MKRISLRSESTGYARFTEEWTCPKHESKTVSHRYASDCNADIMTP